MQKQQLENYIKKQIDDVQERLRAMDADFDEEFLEEIRQTLEGIVVKEMASRGENSHLFTLRLEC